MGLGLGLHVRAVRLWHRLTRTRRQRARLHAMRKPVDRLHIGSGPLVRQGWANVDLEYHKGVEHVLDVRDGLPFRDSRYIYAEHFLEHLTFDEGLRFLKECRNALAADGVLRLSTPNLDWVWATQYRQPSPDAVHDCFAMNKAFRGWGHQFLYNLETLTAALHAAGFAAVKACRYGESDDPVLRDLERHEKSPDDDAHPHVVVIEARGIRKLTTDSLERAIEDYDQALRS
jgi:predicted SAM-dependent methyltransferase